MMALLHLFTATPAKAVPYAPIRELLQQIQGCAQTRLVVVSGRQAREVRGLLGIGNIEVWGCHGQERLAADETLSTLGLDSATVSAIEWSNMLERAGLASLMERKPTGNAVHWRALTSDDAVRLKQKVEAVWEFLEDKHPLRMLRFDGGIEICAASINKGDVVNRVVAELGDSFCIAYLGDDLTDEDAFQAIKGVGLGVLVKGDYRETSADIWLRPPDELVAFPDRWAEACGRQ